MAIIRKNKTLFLVLGITFLVFLFAHWDAINSPYVINDDVRQQIYWMQSWQDPELYQDHYLTDYSRQYVPLGVKGIYRVASYLVNPVQFSKVLTGLLFLTTAGLVYALAVRLGGRLTGVVTVGVFYFGPFLGAMSGGLSRGFVFPLLLLYLFFLARNDSKRAAIVLMIQPLFNPYLFVLCLGTHCLFLTHTWWKMRFVKRGDMSQPEEKHLLAENDNPSSVGRLLLFQLPVVVGVLLIVAIYQIFNVADFGELVSKTDMFGKIEYSAAGRVEIFPVPSIFVELIRPFIVYLPKGIPGIAAYVAGVAFFIALVVLGWQKGNKYRNVKQLHILFYLAIASVCLYCIAYLVMLELFLPRRYLEYSLAVIYCLLAGLFVSSAIESLVAGQKRMLLGLVLVVLAAIKLQGAGIYDYRDQTSLYRFFLSTPKNSMVAGHPELMDNVMTFSKRKGFVTFELSHTWYDQYWLTLKKWTNDFIYAYYSEDPEQIKQFCRTYQIDYVVVRESDFINRRSGGTGGYFEPFDQTITDLLKRVKNYAALDEQFFPSVFYQNGVRVIAPLKAPL